jgi:hypothetical protein
MFAGSCGAVVKDHDGLGIGTSVSEQIGPLGLACARIELGDRGFIGVQYLGREQPGTQRIDQGLQAQADMAQPFRQRAARQGDVVTGEDRFLTLQRQVVGVLLDGDLGQQARRGAAAVDERRGDRLGHDGLAVRAGQLRVLVTAHEEHRRLDVQLLAGVGADGRQRGAAGGAVALFRGVDGDLARQLRTFSSVSTAAPNFAPSFSLSQMPSTSFSPCRFRPSKKCAQRLVHCLPWRTFNTMPSRQTMG